MIREFIVVFVAVLWLSSIVPYSTAFWASSFRPHSQSRHYRNWMPSSSRFLSRMSSTPTESFYIEHDYDTCRLDTYLSYKLPDISRSYAAKLCERGKVLVNNVERGKNYKLQEGETVVVSNYRELEIKIKVDPENIPIDVIYEDKYILAANKVPGMVVHPAIGSPNGTFANALLYYLGLNASYFSINQGTEGNLTVANNSSDSEPVANQNVAEFVRPGIIHRLDRGTSGLLLAGKTPEAVAAMAALFSERKIKKTYIVVCVGCPGDTTINRNIGRDPVYRQQMKVVDAKYGKEAISHIKSIGFNGKLSVVLVRIETGRTHQIRVHLKSLGTPVLGDTEYGNHHWNKRYNVKDRPFLHAYEISFQHPFHENDETKKMKIRAPIAADMLEIIKDIPQFRTHQAPKKFKGWAAPMSKSKPLVDEDGLLTVSTLVPRHEPWEENRVITFDSIRIVDDEDSLYNVEDMENAEFLEELDGNY